MPKSGQAWDPYFLREHPLFLLWERYAAPFRGPVWPTVEQYTAVLRTFTERADAVDRLELSSAQAPVAGLAPLCFRTSKKRSRRQKRTAIEVASLYDGSIALAGVVPCLEESYHDLLNAIVFCAFPRSKRVLHERQYRALCAWLKQSSVLLEEKRLPGQRTREQDALTIFDEGGTLVTMSEAFYRDWAQSGQSLRLGETAWRHVAPLLFGHGLLEHLFEGHVAVRSSGCLLVIPGPELPYEDPEALFQIADRGLAARLADRDEFCRPRADLIFELQSDGEVWIRSPREARRD